MAEIDSSRRSRKKQNTHRAILHNAKILFEQKGIGLFIDCILLSFDGIEKLCFELNRR